jgi:hypothetical protein
VSPVTFFFGFPDPTGMTYVAICPVPAFTLVGLIRRALKPWLGAGGTMDVVVCLLGITIIK